MWYIALLGMGALAMGWIIQTTSPRLPFVLGGLAALACAASLGRAALRGAETNVQAMSALQPAVR